MSRPRFTDIVDEMTFCAIVEELIDMGFDREEAEDYALDMMPDDADA